WPRAGGVHGGRGARGVRRVVGDVIPAAVPAVLLRRHGVSPVPGLVRLRDPRRDEERELVTLGGRDPAGPRGRSAGRRARRAGRAPDAPARGGRRRTGILWHV